MDITRLKNSFDTYFNNILKNALGYKETFLININDREIILTSDGNSQLIERLKYNDTLLDNISQLLLTAFRNNNPDIEYVELEIINNNQLNIKYGFNIYSIKDFNIIANFAKDLDYFDINNLCVSNPAFAEVCKNPQFWIHLLIDKFGSLPDQMPRDIDYRRVYLDVIRYLEYIDKYKSSKRDDILDAIDTSSMLYILKKNILEENNPRAYRALTRSKHIYDHRIYNTLRKKYDLDTASVASLIIINILYRLYKTKNNIEADDLYNLLKTVLEDLLSETNITKVARLISNSIKFLTRVSLKKYRESQLDDQKINLLKSFQFSDKVLDLLESFMQMAVQGYDIRSFIRSETMVELQRIIQEQKSGRYKIKKIND